MGGSAHTPSKEIDAGKRFGARQPWDVVVAGHRVSGNVAHGALQHQDCLTKARKGLLKTRVTELKRLSKSPEPNSKTVCP